MRYVRPKYPCKRCKGVGFINKAPRSIRFKYYGLAKEHFNLRMPWDLLDELRNQAALEEVSVSAVVIRALEEREEAKFKGLRGL